jgi:hypothetical protein
VTRSRFELLPLFTLLALAALTLACGGDEPPPATNVPPTATPDPDARPRSFQMGISAQPLEPTEDAYRDAFDLAADLGELILIQRAPPWEDFLPGGSVSPRTERLTLIERELAQEHNLQLMLAIDPTLPANRGELAGLPSRFEGEGFANSDLRSAFISYAKYLALNYRPAYLALGVEVDLIFINRGDASFRNFVSLYFEAYDAVKEVSPETQVFPTFEYESVLGILDQPPSQPLWPLVARFQPKIDLLALSTFPRSVFGSLRAMPGDYFDAVEGRFDLPVAFYSVGWSSQTGASTDEVSQLSFLLRMAAAADRLESPFLVWFQAHDLPSSDSSDELSTMGLLDSLGGPKDALRVWLDQLARPLR